MSINYKATLNITTIFPEGYGEKKGKVCVLTNGAVHRSPYRYWIQFIPTKGFMFYDNQVIEVDEWMYAINTGKSKEEIKEMKERGEPLEFTPIMFKVGFDSNFFFDGEDYEQLSRQDQHDLFMNMILRQDREENICSIVIEWNAQSKLYFDTLPSTTNMGNDSLGVEVVGATIYFSKDHFRGQKIEVEGEEVNASSFTTKVESGKGMSVVRNNLQQSLTKRQQKKALLKAQTQSLRSMMENSSNSDSSVLPEGLDGM